MVSSKVLLWNQCCRHYVMIVLWTWDLKEELYIPRVQELKCTTTQNNLRQKTTCSCFSYTVLTINKCSFFICHEITIQVHMYWNLTGSTLTLGRSGLTFNIHNHMTILAEVFQHIGQTYFNIQSKLFVFSWNYNESFFPFSRWLINFAYIFVLNIVDDTPS